MNSPASGMPWYFQGEFGIEVSLFCALWLGSSCAMALPLATTSAAAISAAVESFFIVNFSLVDKNSRPSSNDSFFCDWPQRKL